MVSDSVEIPARVTSGEPVEGRWRNRIVRSGVKRAGDFLANPMNWRIHPRNQQQALQGALTEVGWIERVTENIRTGNLINGHARVAEALRVSEDEPVPVDYVDLTEEEERKALLFLDTITGLAATDASLLSELLDSIEMDDPALVALSEQLAQEIGLGTSGPAGRGGSRSSEYEDMPEFHQEDLTPVKQLTVNFASVPDIERFSKLIGQPVAAGTKSIWYPQTARWSHKELVYVADGEGEEEGEGADQEPETPEA